MPTPQPFTCAERAVAQDISTNAIDIANDNDIEAGPYLEAIARVVLAGDLSDRMMASLGRELLQQYVRDTLPLVVAADGELEAAVREAEQQWLQHLRATPTAVLPNRGVTA